MLDMLTLHEHMRVAEPGWIGAPPSILVNELDLGTLNQSTKELKVI